MDIIIFCNFFFSVKTFLNLIYDTVHIFHIFFSILLPNIDLIYAVFILVNSISNVTFSAVGEHGIKIGNLLKDIKSLTYDATVMKLIR